MIYGWQIMLFIAVWVCIIGGAMMAVLSAIIWAVKKIIARRRK